MPSWSAIAKAIKNIWSGRNRVQPEAVTVRPVRPVRTAWEREQSLTRLENHDSPRPQVSEPSVILAEPSIAYFSNPVPVSVESSIVSAASPLALLSALPVTSALSEEDTMEVNMDEVVSIFIPINQNSTPDSISPESIKPISQKPCIELQKPSIDSVPASNGLFLSPKLAAKSLVIDSAMPMLKI